MHKSWLREGQNRDTKLRIKSSERKNTDTKPLEYDKDSNIEDIEQQLNAT